jgi:hypothetical protein
MFYIERLPTMIRYLNLTEFAQRINIERDTLSKYKLPVPDSIVGDRRGWLPATIDTWNASRPGRGNWGPKAQPESNEETAAEASPDVDIAG